MQNTTQVLNVLLQVELIEENEDELMAFRKAYGECTPYVLAARQLKDPAYAKIADSFCSDDLSPPLKELLDLYWNDIKVPATVACGIDAQIRSNIEEYEHEITRLAQGYDCNYVCALVGALEFQGLYSLIEALHI